MPIQLHDLHRLNSIAVLFFLVTIVLMALAIVTPRGQDVFWINSHHSFFGDTFFSIVTNAGDGILILPVFIIFLFVRFHLSAILLVSSAITGVLVSIFKQWLLSAALRPTRVLDIDVLHFVPGIKVHATHSFPSGHTATAFALAFVLALIFNRKHMTVLFLFIALAVGTSRIYLLQHFLQDVAAGAYMGVMSVIFSILILDRFRNQAFLKSRLVFGKQKILVRPIDSSLN
ncbi:MAG: phosphatase PAP2 family protein [Cyclobacteriaceae bacterium]|nr:phosphatase PAP2 family protein [Cyclobacteriaceae bacterium]